MTDQELADKLKARLSAWQGYMEQTQNRSAGEPVEYPPAEGVAPEPPVCDNGVSRLVAEPVSLPNSLIERYEQQIADLRAALEHERHQSRCLAETLAREQALRAASPSPPQNTASSTYSHRSGDDQQREMRFQVLWVFVLLVGVVCCLMFVWNAH